MRAACPAMPKNQQVPIPDLSMLYAEDQRQYIFCTLPKVASSVWRKALLLLAMNKTIPNDTGNMDLRRELGHWNKHFHHMRSYSASDRKFRLRKYFKFMFARDPLERLVSAYRDKIAHFFAYFRSLRRQIIYKYRNHTVVTR
jgi:dermatan 4-sulfotransferase 1